jgi:hypothetical protein
MLLIQMSMDPQCEEIAYDIEKAIRCCLESYNKHLWKKEVNTDTVWHEEKSAADSQTSAFIGRQIGILDGISILGRRHPSKVAATTQKCFREEQLL